EVPLLAVLPGTGGLTRLIDKRKVRRDRADYFCTLEEGVKGKRAVEWNLVDEVVPRTKLEETTRRRASELAARSDRPADARDVALPLRADRARLVLRRYAARAGARRRPLVHAGRHPGGRERPAGHAAADRGELRRLSDAQRPEPPGQPLSRRARPGRRSQGAP